MNATRTPPKDLFAGPSPAELAARREARYADILKRLAKLETADKDRAFYSQRVEDLQVTVEQAVARVRTFDVRLCALEKLAEVPCVCHRELEDLKLTLHDHGQELDELLTAIDKVGTACGLDLFPDTIPERVPAAPPPAAPPEATTSSSAGQEVAP